MEVLEKKVKNTKLLNTLEPTFEDFVTKYEKGDIKAVGLGGQYCENATGNLILSRFGREFFSFFETYWFDTMADFYSELFKNNITHKSDDVYFCDAIFYSENKDFGLLESDENQKKVIDIPFGEIISIIENSHTLGKFIEGELPQKQTLINHIISILSQKDVDCIDLIGLNSYLLEHIESIFTEQTLYFEDEETEETVSGRVFYSENNKAIVMIDDVICVVGNYEDAVMENCTDWNGTGEKYKETRAFGWTW